ncbi:hypothetical protein IFM89_027026 [Coptis chinensis]|uniref:CRAL-TRIO domain-containing protein n=1 Tax=Coptis chinensis TaxID=261450 RepID=A0A835LIU0_9MAGN|nr:hypothetical protein IFM89_027026 [Coptis chinensis]
MEGKKEAALLTEMRKSLEQLSSTTEDYGDAMLMRFLIARSMDPMKAAKMLVKWKKWREEFVPLGFIPDSEVRDELDAKKIYLQGLSKNGQPVVITQAKKHFASKDQTKYKKFVVHQLDKTIASSFKEGKEIGNEKFIAILDFANSSYRNIDSRGLVNGFQILQAYYPERLGKLYILSMPSFFVSAWKMISHFLEKATQEKNYGDAMLMRFLVARSMDPMKAAKMLVSWKKWREEFVPLGFIPDSQVPDELKAKKIYLQVPSKNGQPVLIIQANKHFPSKDQPQFKMDLVTSVLLWIVVLVIDPCCDFYRTQEANDTCSFKEGKEIGNEKLIGILDLANIGYRNIDARALITGFQFLQAYYPERLAKFYILSMPWFFVSAWKMISLFLEKATLEKVVIVSSQDERKTFIKEIGEETLPEEYGGRAKLIALQDVTLNSISIVD